MDQPERTSPVNQCREMVGFHLPGMPGCGRSAATVSNVAADRPLGLTVLLATRGCPVGSIDQPTDLPQHESRIARFLDVIDRSKLEGNVTVRLRAARRMDEHRNVRVDAVTLETAQYVATIHRRHVDVQHDE